MKYSKAVNVTKQDFKRSPKCEFGVFSNTIERLEIDPFKPDPQGSDFACQYNSKRDYRDEICTCKRGKHRRAKYYNSSHQVYRSYPSRYLYSRGYADIGVGSVKALSKKRVKRIYVPELVHTGVGSSELTSFVHTKKRSWGSSYYDQKKTSSKCVGGATIYTNTSVVDKKLSPIIQTKSNSTGPEVVNTDYRNINSGSYTLEKSQLKIKTDNDANDIKIDIENIKQQETIVIIKKQHDASISCVTTYKTKESQDQATDKVKITYAGNTENEQNFSSDSLVQHIYNLENPSLDKQSRTSLDPMENKLEREYRKIFSMKPKLKKSSDDKPMPDFKSASLLRRRFEALRQGIGRKRDSKKGSIVIKASSHASVPSHKDVSIVSDPPSLEARSFSKTKLCSPKPSFVETAGSPTPFYKKSFTGKKETCSNWSTDVVGSEYQGVKGMFRLWGKKFNLDEDICIKTANENFVAESKGAETKHDTVLPKEEFTKSSKKDGKMFSFFRKKTKNKDKSKLPYKSKKSVTAGRCEVGDGLMIKIGVDDEYPLESPVTTRKEITEKYNDILRDTWLQKFVANKIDSRKSAHIRWNNKMFATSSSTVFELMDCVYKNISMIPRSKSEIYTGESSLYYFYTKPKVNFMQDIKAWMIPETILDKHNPGRTSILNISDNSHEQNKHIEVKFSNRKWFIDKSKAFSQNIEIVLHSNNFERHNNHSSEYITINIPEGYFSDTISDNSENSQTSDEEVYKIVEYETPQSSSYLKNSKKEQNMDTGDYISISNDIKVTVSVKDSKNIESKVIETVIKRPPLHRDVVVQGSNVYVPKRCDVIGIGIITQKDLRDFKKPILKIQDYLTDEESEPNLSPQKKCEFAESYLQDYYRNCTPLGIDLFSWCVSDSQLRGSSENNSLNSLNNQGDGSKSCPNIYDDYQASTIVSSCDTSSCSQCRAVCEDEKKPEDSKASKFFGKFIKKSSDPPAPTPDSRRILPKDSVEVFKRRKMYAASNKSNWGDNYDRSEPYSVPSVEDKCAQNDLKSDVGPKTIKPCCKRPEIRKKTCPKRVLLPDQETMNELLSEQLTDKTVEGILTFKGAAGCEVCNTKGSKCPKHARVKASPICEIPQPQCKDSCLSKKSPACSKKNSPTCNVPKVPSCPAGLPSPCQKPCPPTPPPCAMTPPCMKEARRSPCESPPTCPKQQYTPPCPKSPPLCPKPPPPSLKRGAAPRSPSLTSYSIPLSPCATNGPHLCRPKPLPPRIHSPMKSPPKRLCRSPPKRPSKVNQCKVPDCPSKSSIGQSLKSKPCDLPDCPSISSVQQPSKTKKCNIPDCPSNSSFQRSPMKRHTKNPQQPSKVKPCDVPDCPSKSSFQSPVKEKHCALPECPSKSSFRRQQRPKQCKVPDCPSKSSFQQCPTPPPGKCRKIESQESGLSLKKTGSNFSPKNSLTKCANAVKHLIDKVSSFTLRRGKECKPDCANRTKLANRRPPSPPRQEIHSDESCRSRTKQTGLHLKKLPLPKKNCDIECVRRDKNNIIRLNSKEEIFIKLKQRTPSTEEIREGCNIKVQDEDGQTLYERRDYRRSDGKNRTFLVRDMYRDSHVNRVSTPNLGNDNLLDKKSSDSKHVQDPSISNIVEINLTLKFIQKDKTTEVSINNADDRMTDNQETNTRESPKEVYVLQGESKKQLKEEDKKDLNIKITIKNYRQNAATNEQTPEHFDNDEFTKKISDKFNTVSTGYSEVLLEPQAYSMHKTTIDLTSSKDNNKSESEIDKEIVQVMNKENTLCDLPTKNESSNTEQETVKLWRSEISVKCDTITDNNMSNNKEKDTDVKSIVSKTGSYVTENTTLNNNNTASSDRSKTSENESKINHKQGKKYPLSILKSNDKDEKKEILKEIFETASNLKEHKKKAKMKQIRQMLHAILTSDSDEHEDVSISNKLADEVTYASLKPNYFRDTDSMTNYCQFDSLSVSDKKSSKSASEEQLYPTEEDNTETSEGSSGTETSAKDNPACLCSHFATRLNINDIGDTPCCCRRMETKNEETSCDLTEDYKCLNYKTKYVNVETQNSKYVSSRIQSVVMTNMSTTVRIQPGAHESFGNVCNPLIRKKLSTNRNKECHVTTFIKNVRDHSEGEIVILESNSEDSLRRNTINIKPADILQLNETKKAVLEIYAEKTVSDKGQRIVARLPKFITNRESQMRNYHEVITGFKHVSRRNIAMLSITR